MLETKRNITQLDINCYATEHNFTVTFVYCFVRFQPDKRVFGDNFQGSKCPFQRFL